MAWRRAAKASEQPCGSPIAIVRAAIESLEKLAKANAVWSPLCFPEQEVEDGTAEIGYPIFHFPYMDF
jgi:hypothetical protein